MLSQSYSLKLTRVCSHLIVHKPLNTSEAILNKFINEHFHIFITIRYCVFNSIIIQLAAFDEMKYSRLSLTQLCITQYYHLSGPDGPVPVFSPIYYCNSTTFISTTAKSIKLITRYEKLVPLINFSVFYNA